VKEALVKALSQSDKYPGLRNAVFRANFVILM
jgi:hypothetical protein